MLLENLKFWRCYDHEEILLWRLKFVVSLRAGREAKDTKVSSPDSRWGHNANDMNIIRMLVGCKTKSSSMCYLQDFQANLGMLCLKVYQFDGWGFATMTMRMLKGDLRATFKGAELSSPGTLMVIWIYFAKKTLMVIRRMWILQKRRKTLTVIQIMWILQKRRKKPWWWCPPYRRSCNP